MKAQGSTFLHGLCRLFIPLVSTHTGQAAVPALVSVATGLDIEIEEAEDLTAAVEASTIGLIPFGLLLVGRYRSTLSPDAKDYVTEVLEMAAGTVEAVTRLFMQVDNDGTGQLDVEELTRVFVGLYREEKEPPNHLLARDWGRSSSFVYSVLTRKP